MKNGLLILIISITILGCNFSPIQSTATTIPYSPEPTLAVPITPQIISTITPETPIPSYKGKLFSIVFIRNGNLWIANIGEEIIERQLTFEQEMRIIDFDISPDETRVAYIPYQLEPLNSLIKIVDISTGITSVILGENDPFSEIRVVWLDNSTIAYKNQGHAVPTFTTESVEIITKYIVYNLSTKKQVGITDFYYMLPSPDRNFWLGCFGGAEGCGLYGLQDLINNKQYKLEGNIRLGGFLGWSSDSQFMLFNTLDLFNPPCTSRLIMIDTQTLEQKIITAEDDFVASASFSPTEKLLFYKQDEIIDFGICKSGEVKYLVLNIENQEIYEIPVEFRKEVWDFTWSPDGTHLLFFHDSYSGREHELWSMNLNGTDLQFIIPDVEEFKILINNP